MKIIDSQVETHRERLRHDFSITDGECTQYNFSQYFDLDRHVCKQRKLNRRLTRSRKIWQIILQLVGAVRNFSVVVTTKSEGIFFHNIILWKIFSKTPSNGK